MSLCVGPNKNLERAGRYVLCFSIKSSVNENTINFGSISPAFGQESVKN